MILLDYEVATNRPTCSEIVLLKYEDQLLFSDEVEIICQITCLDGSLLLVRLRPKEEKIQFSSLEEENNIK